MECVIWKEAAEPGVITQPPPEGDLAPDEDETYVPPSNGALSDPEAGEGSDDYEDFGYGVSQLWCSEME